MVDFAFAAADERFRDEARAWTRDHLVGEFAKLGTGHDLGEAQELDVRRAWERALAAGGWVGIDGEGVRRS